MSEKYEAWAIGVTRKETPKMANRNPNGKGVQPAALRPSKMNNPSNSQVFQSSS
jgi:hypothetical protein